ncbi:MAG: hypothetical protein H6873_02535 [Hyphomicrobiaceae bacterium]|nr:hypothetical protein [Hyphomicrobiaceae bacterium]
MQKALAAKRPLTPIILALAVFWSGLPVFADEVGPVSGLPLPRFVSLRSEPINVRVGPGTRYDVAWVFVKADLPVEIIQEFDTWRKIRDIDGQEGWIHQNLLVGTRTAYVAPWKTEPVQLRVRSGDASRAVAELAPRVLVRVDSCDGEACKVATFSDQSGGTSYSGYVDQEDLWGVYANEEFD